MKGTTSRCLHLLDSVPLTWARPRIRNLAKYYRNAASTPSLPRKQEQQEQHGLILANLGDGHHDAHEGVVGG
jgi:hypothetical protein